MSSLKQYILSNHTIEEIIADFREMFPPFAIDPSDDVLTQYINISFCNIPNGFVNCDCGDSDCAYTAFLYGLAHNLVYFKVLGDTSQIPALQKNAKSKSADGLSITYENLVSDGTPANIANYFGTSAYGIMLLGLLDSCGLTMSPGGFAVWKPLTQKR